MECIDGHPVVNHRVRFRGRADITEDDAQSVRDGQTVIWLVRSRCRPPQYHPVTADSDDRYRFNEQDVEVVIPLAGETRNQALAYLDHHGTAQGYLSFDIPRHPSLDLEQTRADLGLDRDLDDALAYLDAHNARRPGETLVDVLRRLLEPEPEPGPVPLPLPPPGDGVEVVGSVYRNGHPGATQAILEEQFGRP